MCIENNLMVAKGEELEEWKFKKKKKKSYRALSSQFSLKISVSLLKTLSVLMRLKT